MRRVAGATPDANGARSISTISADANGRARTLMRRTAEDALSPAGATHSGSNGSDKLSLLMLD
jgi:hypothetical protein